MSKVVPNFCQKQLILIKIYLVATPSFYTFPFSFPSPVASSLATPWNRCI